MLCCSCVSQLNWRRIGGGKAWQQLGFTWKSSKNGRAFPPGSLSKLYWPRLTYPEEIIYI